MIPKIESKVLDMVHKRVDLLFYMTMLILSIAIRLALWGFASKDYIYCLKLWFDEIKELGFQNGMAYPVGNYNVPYQIIINIMTRIPGISSLSLYKILSVAFDYLLAFSCVTYAKSILRISKKRILAMVYMVVLFLPTVVLNSAAWAQCDAIYISFMIFALIFLYKRRYFLAFIMLGLSFSFKLQAVFIIPFFLYWYFKKKDYSILYFLLLPIVNIVMCFPAIASGRHITSTFTVYKDQIEFSTKMSMNALNFWELMGGQGDNYPYLRSYAIIFTIVLLGVGLYYLLKSDIDLSDGETFTSIALWTLFTVYMFLPAMHERYSFGIEILFCLLALVRTRKRVLSFIFSQIIGVVNYSGFLLGQEYNKEIWAIFYLALFMWFTYDCIVNIKGRSPITLPNNSRET